MKLTKAQILLLDKIRRNQPVSAIRLGVVRSPANKTLKALVDAGAIEPASQGMFGVNWQLSSEGVHLAETLNDLELSKI